MTLACVRDAGGAFAGHRSRGRRERARVSSRAACLTCKHCLRVAEHRAQLPLLPDRSPPVVMPTQSHFQRNALYASTHNSATNNGRRVSAEKKSPVSRSRRIFFLPFFGDGDNIHATTVTDVLLAEVVR